MDTEPRRPRESRFGGGRLTIVGLLGVAGASILSGCERNALGPEPVPDGVPEPPFISDPVSRPSIAPGGFQPELQVGRLTDSVSYVSFPPETFPGGDSIRIDNVANGASAGAPLFEGGLDPLSIAASVGDTLQLTVWTGAGSQVMLRGVPFRHAITVVRTEPRRGRTSVPINLSVTVVMSEPAQLTTVNQQTVQLLRAGEPVPVEVRLRPDGLVVEIIPVELLAHETTYTIVVTTEVRDLSGDPLPSQFESEFTTASIELIGKLVFQSNRAGGSELYLIDAAGGDATRLTYHVGGGVSEDPAVSRDGRQIAFSAFLDGPTGPIVESEVYVMNVDGTGLQNLTRDPAFDGTPAWSPDGSRIAFMSTRGGSADVWVMNADGSDPVQLTSDPAWEGTPDWSPDGSKIAFARDGGPGIPVDIFVVNADGTGIEQLTFGPSNAWHPSWSPDGSRIACEGLGIEVMNADGSERVTVLPWDDFPAVEPAWSPDGSAIAIVRWGGGIYYVNPDGTNVREVTDGRGDTSPAWSP
jgi:TolB protein